MTSNPVHLLSLSRRARSGRVLLCWMALLLPPHEALSESRTAAADPPIPVCIYASRSYSSGALLCIHRSLALVCRSDGPQAIWVAETDKEISGRCGSATASRHPPSRLRAAFRTRHGEPATSGANSALQDKCFDFAGKRYCE
jgi:hypothetical protein